MILMFGLAVLLSLSHIVNASQFNTVSFTYGYIHGSLEFPEEAHPTDTIMCNLTVAAYIDVTIYNLTLAISGLVGEKWQTLHTEQIISYPLAQGGSLSKQVIVTLPQNMSERLNYVIEGSTDKGFGETSFYATYVRATTYDALSNLYYALLTNHSRLQADYDHLSDDLSVLNISYNSLAGEFSTIQRTYNSLNSSYESLDASYASLTSGYNSLQGSYNYIKTKYDTSAGELSILRYLMYAFGISTVVLAATTIYFRKKAPYIVLRKETADSR